MHLFHPCAKGKASSAWGCGLESRKGFHAGTAMSDGQLVTSGGAQTLKHARERGYKAVSQIRFEGVQFRRGIALKGLVSGQ